MNKAILMGRLARDPEIRRRKAVFLFTITVACDRRSRDEGGNWKTKPILSCVAWRQQAEFVNRYFEDDRILVSGAIRPRSWRIRTDSVVIQPRSSSTKWSSVNRNGRQDRVTIEMITRHLHSRAPERLTASAAIFCRSRPRRYVTAL